MRLRKIAAVSTALSLSAMCLPALAETAETTGAYPFGTLQRRMEKLDRGLVAMQTEKGIYLSWRLMNDEDAVFGTAEENVSFEIYRNGEKVDDVEDTTNYLDTLGSASSVYKVVSSRGGESAEVTAFESGSNYFDIPVDRPPASPYGAYTINDTSVGDLDGDGQYELIIKWDSNGKDNSHSGTTGEVLLDAYRLDGTRLWDSPINLGKNIRAGAHYTQFLVYDFDGDGRSEITCKTAPGSVDAQGRYVSAASADEAVRSCDNSADYRNSGGYILDGDEYFTVFEGETGRAIDTIYYPNQRLLAEVWGDTYGNRLDRYTAAVAYMDGSKPYAVYMRGYYMGSGSERQAACAISFDGERLECSHSFDTYDVSSFEKKSASASYTADGTYKGVDGYRPENAVYPGEGNHNCTVADVDGDGKDDVLTGALCYEFDENDRLGVKWCTFLEHGDALHIGDYDPTHDGYEFFTVHEDGGINKFNKNVLDYGMSVIDPATGEIMFHRGASGDTGRGMMANVGAGGYYQFWGAGTFKSLGGGSFEAMNLTGASSNFRIFWDGDLYDELMDGQTNSALSVTAWNGKSMNRIFTTDGAVSVNGTKANPSLQADILGDWREELVMARGDNNALRVFVSDIPTDYKMMTLMHDSVYRSGVAAEQSGYNQPPHIGFYLAETSFSGPVTDLDVKTPPAKTRYYVNEKLDTAGMEVQIIYENSKAVDISDYTVSGYDPMAAGVQEVSAEYEGVSGKFEVTVVTGFKADAEGTVTGFEPTGESMIILPESIDGTKLTGFADGALKGAGISNIYIYDDSLDFGVDVFDSDITVHAPTGSTAEEYCAANGIAFASTSVVYSYMADVDFESGDYSPYIGNFVVTQPQGVADTKSFEGITYGSNPRNDAWPDATTGIKMGSENGNTYVVPVAGEFSTGGRHSWIDIDEKVELSTVSEYTLSFDILYPTDCGTLYLTLTNGDKTVDGVEMTSDMSPDTWYTYTYTYDSEKNLTRTIRQGNTIISTAPLGSRAADTFGINHIDFTRDDNGPNPSTLWGGWGNHGMGKCALAYMDNIRVYTPERSSAFFKILDNYGFAVEGATVTMGTVTVKTDKNGEARIAAQNGEYEAVISAEGYGTVTRTVSLLDGITTVEAALAPELTVSFDRESLRLAKGAYFIARYEVKPVERGFTEFTSSDSSVAEVDSDGIIHGVGAGEADITVTNTGISDTLHITVAESDGEAAAISLTGEKSYRTASYLSPYISVISAEVYDSSGALINAPVSFSADNAEITASETGAMFTVDGDLKSFTLTAECGEARTDERINVNAAADYANSDFDSSVSMLQGREAQSQAVGESGITLNVGNRGNGGDNFTGFIMKDGILTAQAGQYNTASRNAYITLDKAPSMNKSTEYMLRTRIRFNSGAGDATVTVGDGSVAGVTLSPARTGFERDVWYDYILSVKDGAATQIIRNESSGEVGTESISVSSARLSRIDITNADGARSSVSFDSLSLTGADKIIASAVVSVTDEYGELIEGADVKGALGEGTTRINGRVSLPCFEGANSFDVTAGGRSKTVAGVVSGSFSPVTAAMTEDRTQLRRADNDKPVYYVISYEDTPARAIKSDFDGNGRFAGAQSTDIVKGKSIVTFTDTNSAEKVFLWKNGTEPLTNPAQ